MKEIEAIVEAGKATAGPPLGPQLGPLQLNIPDVIKKINEKTKDFEGMEVPIKVLVDEETKEFSVEVGTPSVSAMIKKELGTDKLAVVDEDGNREDAGNISLEAVKKIAKNKKDMAGSFKKKVKQILGTCLSCGVSVEGKNPKEITKEIEEGKIKIK